MQTFTPKGNIQGPILPTFVMRKRISLGAKVMYALLCHFAGEKDHCWPSHATLAALIPCSVSSVKTYLDELNRVQLISIHRERYRTSTYYLLTPATKAQETNFTYQKPNSDHLNSGSKDINAFKNINTNYPPLPPANDAIPSHTSQQRCPGGGGGYFSADEDFEKFFAAYPRKEAKGLARDVWRKLSRYKRLPPLSTLLTAVERFQRTEKWQRENGRFIPQLSNWLRGERWDDPLPEEAAPLPFLAPRGMSPAQRTAAMLDALEAEKGAAPDPALLQLKPVFERFAAQFPDGERMHGPAFGLWSLLHKKGKAPQPDEVEVADTGIMAFLQRYQTSNQERIFA